MEKEEKCPLTRQSLKNRGKSDYPKLGKCLAASLVKVFIVTGWGKTEAGAAFGNLNQSTEYKLNKKKKNSTHLKLHATESKYKNKTKNI